MQDEDSAQKSKRLSDVNGSVKRTKRASGGFLLDSSPTSSRLSRSVLSQKLVKGKQKLDGQTLSVSKRRPQIDGQDSRSSIGASPLSSEIKSSPPLNGRISPSRNNQNASPSQALNGSVRSHGSASSRQPASSYGFDTDPAQIVEMALRLNEGRRRQASAKRYVSNGTEGKRIISTATSLPPRSSPSVRKPSRPDPVTPQKRPRDFDSEIVETSPLQDWSPEQDADSPEDSMQISRATQNRVNKAKTYFELAYEHRRLISHLPPTRPPEASFDPEKPGYDSRAYNPLQYARNRKLRFRERAALNTASEGWHDVLKVRAWVDAVINSHSGMKHDPLECVRLPPLTLLERGNSEGDPDANTGTKSAANTAKARRPKSDWVTHPGDMIADAFWTEQGLNKQKIYNRDNELIYPPGTKFRFSGWRNRTPIDVPDELRASSSPEDSPTADRKQSLPALPDLPTFESAHKDHSWARTRSKFSKALNRRSRSSKTKDHEIFNTSSESSDSNDDADLGNEPRGRRRLTKRQEKLILPDGDPFALPARSIDHAERNHSSGVESSVRGSQQDHWDHATLHKHLRRDSASMSGTQGDAERQRLAKRRGFLSSIKVESDNERARTSFEYDSTAPPTPAAYGFPSIAINLSPPHSRSPSPTKKHKGSFLGVVKDKMQPQKERIDRTDFARDPSLSKESRERSSISRHKKQSYDVSRGTSPMSRGISPFAAAHARSSLDEPPPYAAEPRASTISKVSSKTTDSGAHRSHRVRGMFKGGRIAELVGNEVSRVGEFIWKRDPPRRSDITETGSTSGYESDSDELMDGRNRPNRPLAQVTESLPSSSPSSVKNVNATSPVKKSTPHETPQFHIQGLPSFTSPFQRDREEIEKKTRAQSPGGTPQRDPHGNGYDDDPISTAAKARRAAGRSPRFDNLAPPRLDIRAATPDGRRSSYGFGEALDLSRTLSASYLFNNAINGEPLQPQSSLERRSTALSRFQSTDLTKVASNDSGIPKHITIQDCLRTRSLLLTIAVKATNVADYADSIPEQQSAFLYSVFDTTGASGSEINQYLPARRREEQVIAARHLISRLNDLSATFNDHLNHFTTYTTPDLQREIQILEDKADKTLFPRLQSLSDSAGQLAQQLTTTNALNIKSANDEVAEARRLQRRGPGVIGRWFGYKLIEWGVVSMLWAIWFVVKVCRFGIGTVQFIWGAIAWLFWLR